MENLNDYINKNDVRFFIYTQSINCGVSLINKNFINHLAIYKN